MFINWRSQRSWVNNLNVKLHYCWTSEILTNVQFSCLNQCGLRKVCFCACIVPWLLIVCSCSSDLHFHQTKILFQFQMKSELGGSTYGFDCTSFKQIAGTTCWICLKIPRLTGRPQQILGSVKCWNGHVVVEILCPTYQYQH